MALKAKFLGAGAGVLRHGLGASSGADRPYLGQRHQSLLEWYDFNYSRIAMIASTLDLRSSLSKSPPNWNPKVLPGLGCPKKPAIAGPKTVIKHHTKNIACISGVVDTTVVVCGYGIREIVIKKHVS